jgi:hypothetical protein
MKEPLPTILLLCCTLTFILGVACSCQTSPAPDAEKVRIKASLGEERIRAEVLKYTPLGISSDRVLTFVHTRMRHVNTALDAISPNPVIRHFYGSPKRHPEVIGKSSILVLLGRSGLNPLTRREVYIGWAFENDRLIDVVVEKERDSL